MKKILDVLDPRKSNARDHGGSESSRIILSGSEETFAPHQLNQALKAASNQSNKSKSIVKVILPRCTVALKGNVTLGSQVEIVGYTDLEPRGSGSNAFSHSSKVTLASGTSIQMKSGSVKFSNLMLIASEKTKAASPIFNVHSEATLELEECVLDLADGATSDVLGFSSQGNLKISGCFLNNWRIEVEKNGLSEFNSSHFVNKVNKQSDVDSSNSCAVMFTNCASQEMKKCEITNYGTAVHIEATSKGSSVLIEECNFHGILNALVVDSACVNLSESDISAKKGVGCTARNGAFIELSKTTVKDFAVAGIVAGTGAELKLQECSIVGNGSNANKQTNGLEVLDSAKVSLIQSMISKVSGIGALCQGEGSLLEIVDCELAENRKIGLMLRDDGSLRAKELRLKDNEDKGMLIKGPVLSCTVDELEIRSGNIGVSALNAYVQFTNVKCFDLKEMAYEFVDCSGLVATSHVNHVKSKAPGIKVLFKESKEEKFTLRECKMQSCSEGIKVEQLNSYSLKRAAHQPQDIIDAMPSDTVELYDAADEMYTINNRNKQKVSKCELENCSFILCQIGFSVDGAKASLKGCSFIMNFRHSVFIKNLALQHGPNVRKISKLKVRWPNYVEPHIDNGSALSNEQQLLTSVTQEKAFCGSADFEPVMYLPTLTERIKQARSFFRSREEDNVHRARVIMRSVSHMLILLKHLTERLLQKHLLDDPNLGMFAATFNLYETKRPKRPNTLIEMKELFSSWKKLARTRLFDSALAALNEAFSRKQVDEDLYDAYVTPLEEMQRVCFVNSKYNRRRDYLLTTAKENPLTTWYFLDKEDPHTDEGKRLRGEVLRFLAADSEDNRIHNTTNFHASWVAQWAVRMLGSPFTEEKIPDKLPLRKAWADKLLDDGDASRILEQYKTVESSNSYKTDADQLIKFEALMLYEKKKKLDRDQLNLLSQVLGGNGLAAAMRQAGKMFRGEGALPGFLRRVVENTKDPEELLDVLSNINEDTNNANTRIKKWTVLAVMSHFYTRDSQNEPKLYKHNHDKYETCPSCLVQKLQPWNELHLERCEAGHCFCRACLKTAMSQGVTGLWGRCPGMVDGEPCPAVASRREMEMAGMDQEKIYNILEARITKELQALPGWRPCDSPGCIGGRTGGPKDYYTCHLCKKMVTMDGGKSDPTVNKRLLTGLDGSSIARGQGIFRECYWCGVIYEKGNACSTITCSHCNKTFSMTWGPDKITHRFDEEGVGPQMYVPKKPAALWDLGVFKDKKGNPLELGQKLTPQQAQEVVRRAKLLLAEIDG